MQILLDLPKNSGLQLIKFKVKIIILSKLLRQRL